MTTFSRDIELDALVGLYFRVLGVPGPAELTDFRFGGSDERVSAVVRVARLPLPTTSSDGLWFFGSVGMPSRHPAPEGRQFVGIFDSPSVALAELIGSAAHFDSFVAPLNVGDTFPLGPASALRGVGYEAVLVLGADLYRPFEAGEFAIGSRRLQVMAAIPLNGREMALKRAEGIDGFLQSAESEGKDWLHVEVPVTQ